MELYMFDCTKCEYNTKSISESPCLKCEFYYLKNKYDFKLARDLPHITFEDLRELSIYEHKDSNFTDVND